MPHFCECGGDEYVCQKCGGIFCSDHTPSQWRPDITSNKSAGNVCPKCLKEHDSKPIGLYEHCKQESGLTDPEAIRRYMNRYYGHR